MKFIRFYIKFNIKIDKQNKNNTDPFICRTSPTYKADIDSLKNKIYWEDCVPYDFDDSDDANVDLASLLNEGWKIVSTCPVTATRVETDKSNRWNVVTKTFTYTDGIEVFLTRDF